jgi:hypothetical protein
MAVCPKLEKCPFFADRMSAATAVAEMMKRRYCAGTPADCARYRVSIAGMPVPPDLFPNQGERAVQMLRHR